MINLMASMEKIYQMDYQFGWVNKNDLKGYVAQGFLSTDGYKRITGDDYVQASQQV